MCGVCVRDTAGLRERTALILQKIYLEYRTRTRLLDPQAARAAPSHTRSPTLAYLAYLTTHTPVPVEKSRKNSSDWPWRLEQRVLQIILEGTSLLHRNRRRLLG